MNKNEYGFTLIELLITLTIIAFIISLSAPFLINIFERQAEKQFITLLEQDILLLQNSSFGKYEYNRIIFRDDHYTLAFKTDREKYITRHYPKHLTLRYNNTNIINFNHKGTIVNPGTISIKSKHMNKKIVFPFGRGRFYVKEQ